MNAVTKSVSASAPVRDEQTVKTLYLEAVRLVERVHRRFLDVVKDEFDRQGRSDVNSVQAVLLFNIGGDELTAGELKSRGYYQGSNVSYNLKKLVDSGHVNHQRSNDDKRAVRISLSPKGREVADVVARLFDRQVRTITEIGGLGEDEFGQMNASLQRLDRYWTDQILYRL